MIANGTRPASSRELSPVKIHNRRIATELSKLNAFGGPAWSMIPGPYLPGESAYRREWDSNSHCRAVRVIDGSEFTWILVRVERDRITGEECGVAAMEFSSLKEAVRHFYAA